MRISDWSSDVCSSDLDAELLAQRPLVEGELHVEGAREAGLQRLQRGLGEALGLQALVSHAGRILQRAVADRVADDRLDAALVVAEGAQRLGHRAVDDLEVAAAGQLLELHDGEVRLDRNSTRLNSSH